MCQEHSHTWMTLVVPAWIFGEHGYLWCHFLHHGSPNDTKLDLSTWGKDDFYTARSVTGKNRNFQLNLCKPVNGICKNESVACEIDDTEENLVANILTKDPQRIVTYDEMKEIITLKYIDSQSHKVEINIECDKNADEHEHGSVRYDSSGADPQTDG